MLAEQEQLIAFKMHVSRVFSQSAPVQEMLQQCAEALVQHLGVALARIWLLDRAGKVLEQYGSAGEYTHRDGFHDRISIGQGIIGQIAQDGQPYVSNAAVNDTAISNQEWLQREELLSFVGIPLLIGERVLGVMACFARTPLSTPLCQTLQAEAHTLAWGIEHQRTEVALQKSEAYFRSLVENALDLVFVLNSDGTLRYTSPSVTRMLGWTPAELLDQSVFTFVHEEEVSSVLDTFGDLILHPEQVRTTEIRLQRKDGSWRSLEVTGKSLLGDPDVTGVIVNAHDITDRQLMLRELEENRLHMVQAAKLTELGEMATSIAHEINQPLTAIKMAADLLLRALRPTGAPPPAILSQMLEKISSQVERATAIINHMRALGHTPTGICSPLHLNTVVHSALTLFEHQLKAHNISVHTNLDERIPPILGEQIPLEQVLIALINNARDAMDEEATARRQRGQRYEKRLTIDTALVAGRVRLTLTDNGPGISAETQQRIFAPFFTTKGVGKGTGLGLSVSYRIIQQYGGVLEVESCQGAGATFILRFPPLDEGTALRPPT